MKLLRELLESTSTTESALDQLLYNSNQLYGLYVDKLTGQLRNMYAEGNHEDMFKVATRVIGQSKGLWFQDNYLSTSFRRDKPTAGMKNALRAIAADHKYRSCRHDLDRLGSFELNMKKEKQPVTSSQYVGELEERLPILLHSLSQIAPESFRERLEITSHRLHTAIENFHKLWNKLQSDWERDWGEEDPIKQQDDLRKKQEQDKKSAIGTQNSSVEGVINDVLSKLDKRVAAELRQIVARSDNKLATLQRELDKRGIRL